MQVLCKSTCVSSAGWCVARWVLREGAEVGLGSKNPIEAKGPRGVQTILKEELG